MERVFQRILIWVILSGAVALDLVGVALGFYVPGMGRASTREWLSPAV
jgi:hypothetical protein